MACIFLFLCGFAYADNITIGASPAWLFRLRPDLKIVPEEKEITNGYYLELVDKQTNVPAQSEYTHFIRHIVNQTGVQNASEVSVNFVPDYQQVIFHQVTLIRDGRVVSNLKLPQIKVVQEETEASEFQYNGIKRAFVILKDVRINDRIEVAYTITGFNPVFNGKFSDQVYFHSGIATANYFQTLITTKAHPLNFRYFNAAPSPRKFHHDDTLMYFWQDPPLKAKESNNHTPSWFSTENSVSVTEFKDWKEVVDWGLGLFRNYNVPLSPAINSKIAAFKEKANGDQAKFISLATQFVQDQVRYLGLETGIYTHHPHDPAQVCDQRYGDCKDKAFLLAMMLRGGGVNAYVAFANTELTSELKEQDASPYKFNHVIVAVEKGSDYQYIDATIANQRGPLKDLFIPPYGYVLIVKKDNNALSEVKRSGYRKTTIKEKLFVNYHDKGPSMLEVESDYEGYAADNNRSTIAGMGLASLQKSYLQFYTKLYDSIEIEKEVKIIDDTVNNKIHVSERYRIPNVWHTNSKGKDVIAIYAHPLADMFPDPGHSYHFGPLELSYPQDMHYTLELHTPGNDVFTDEDYHLTNAAYKFDYRVRQADSFAVLDYRFVSFRDYIEETNVGTYREDYKKIVTLTDFSYSLAPDNGQPRSTETVAAPSAAAPSKGISTMGLLMFLFTLVAEYFVFTRLNSKYAETDYVAGTGNSLSDSAWLIILGMILFCQLILQAWQSFFSYNFFSQANWEAMGQLGGGKLQSLVLIEQVLDTILAGFNVALIYWYLKRRDIFPKMFIAYLVTRVSCVVLVIALYAFISYPEALGDINKNAAGRFIITALYASLWIAYMLRSQDVKLTFIEPWLAPKPHRNSYAPVPKVFTQPEPPATTELPGTIPHDANPEEDV